MMPTPEQIERAARASWEHEEGDDVPPCGWSSLWDEERSELLANMRAALLAARPTPEEHKRGIEAACIALVGKAWERRPDEAKATIREAMGRYVSAYLAATGGANG